MKTKKNTDFMKGLSDGIPIGLGYLSVAIGIGIMAVNAGLNVGQAVIISMTNLTSAGEVAGINVIAALGPFTEMLLMMLVINIRYSLMAVSLSQKLDESFTIPKRLFCGMFITDEIFGVASSYDKISTKYIYGLAIIPFIGWNLGTFIGAYAGEVVPKSVALAIGLSIYGMFTAIVIPAAKKDKGNAIAVFIAVLLSVVIYYFFSFISYGFSVIISSVIASLFAAMWRCKYE